MFKTATQSNLETVLDENLAIAYAELQKKLPTFGTYSVNNNVDLDGKAVKNPFTLGSNGAYSTVSQTNLANETIDPDDSPVEDGTGNGSYTGVELDQYERLSLVDTLNPYTDNTPLIKYDNLSSSGTNGGTLTGTLTSVLTATSSKVTGTNLPEQGRLGDTTPALLYQDPRPAGQTTPAWQLTFPTGQGVDISGGFTSTMYVSRQFNSVLEPVTNGTLIDALSSFNANYRQGFATPIVSVITDKDRATGNYDYGLIALNSTKVVFNVRVGTKSYYKAASTAELWLSAQEVQADPTLVQAYSERCYVKGKSFNLFNDLRHPNKTGDENRRVFYIAFSWNPATPKNALLFINSRAFVVELDELNVTNPPNLTLFPFVYTQSGYFLSTNDAPNGEATLARTLRNAYISKLRVWNTPLSRENLTVDFGKYL